MRRPLAPEEGRPRHGNHPQSFKLVAGRQQAGEPVAAAKEDSPTTAWLEHAGTLDDPPSQLSAGREDPPGNGPTHGLSPRDLLRVFPCSVPRHRCIEASPVI